MTLIDSSTNLLQTRHSRSRNYILIEKVLNEVISSFDVWQPERLVRFLKELLSCGNSSYYIPATNNPGRPSTKAEVRHSCKMLPYEAIVQTRALINKVYLPSDPVRASLIEILKD